LINIGVELPAASRLRTLKNIWEQKNAGGREMPAHSSTHFFLNWAKERIDEMDATLASLEGKAAQIQGGSRVEADHVIADLRRKRDAFRAVVKTQTAAGEEAWAHAKTKLEGEWDAFEAELGKYIETFGREIQQRQATFQSQVAAQMKAWREIADQINVAATEFATEPRAAIEATATRMKDHAAAAEKKLHSLGQTGTAPWSLLNAALAETRTVFDRANQVAQEAFKQAMRPK
jgi:hypothetical protein